jgi:hypothetical protein
MLIQQDCLVMNQLYVGKNKTSIILVKTNSNIADCMKV